MYISIWYIQVGPLKLWGVTIDSPLGWNHESTFVSDLITLNKNMFLIGTKVVWAPFVSHQGEWDAWWVFKCHDSLILIASFWGVYLDTYQFVSEWNCYGYRGGFWPVSGRVKCRRGQVTTTSAFRGRGIDRTKVVWTAFVPPREELDVWSGI